MSPKKSPPGFDLKGDDDEEVYQISARGQASKAARRLLPVRPSERSVEWVKKVRGKLHYFGLWDDADSALQLWLDEKDDLLAGRTPRQISSDGLTLKKLCDHFLTEKMSFLDSDELSPRTYRDCYDVCQFMADTFGKHRLVSGLAPDDFSHLRREFAKVHGAVRLKKEIGIIRMVFGYGFDAELMERPVRFGPSFKAPSKTNLRKARQARGKKDFDSDEIRRLLDALPVPLRAMILLGINCGFGQSDCANLPQSAIDLQTGWIDYPRPKTAIERRCPLWPETIDALGEAIKNRPNPKVPADDGCAFLTKYGNRWVRLMGNDNPAKRSAVDSVAQEFSKVLKSLDINGRRNFYSLRHTFETQAGESRDQVAVDRIMGHSDNSMAANYRHHISDERLKAVTDTVHRWLFPPEEEVS